MNAQGNALSRASGGHPTRFHYGILLLCSSLIVGIFAWSLYRSPIIDSDTYEFLTVARSLVENGTLTEPALRSYIGPEPMLELPHPADHRANLMPFLLAPAYLLFGESQLTFAAPYLLLLLFTPWIMYRVFSEWFGPRAALAGCLTFLFHPRLWYYSLEQDCGNVDLYNAVLVLISLYLFLHRKHWQSGLAAGTAVMFKVTGILLLPVYAGYWLLYQRTRRTFKDLLVVFLFLLLPILPFLARNVLVFHNPFFSEEFVYEGYHHAGGEDEFWLSVLVGLPESDAHVQHRPDMAKPRLERLADNLKGLFLGRRLAFGFFPGLFDSVGYLLLPFLLFGAWKRRAAPTWRLLTLTVLITAVLLGVVSSAIEDRNYWLLWILCPPMAFKATEFLPGSFRRSGTHLLAFCLLLSLLSLVPTVGGKLMDDRARGEYLEFKELCRWIEQHSGEEAVIMTVPYWSPAFYHKRLNVPLPFSELEVIDRTIRRYDVRYLLLDRMNFPEPFPLSSNLSLILKGERYELFEVLSGTREAPAWQRPPLASYVPSYAASRMLKSCPLPVPSFLTYFTMARVTLGGFLPALLLLYSMGTLWLFLYRAPRGFLLSTLFGILFLVTLAAPVHAYYQAFVAYHGFLFRYDQENKAELLSVLQTKAPGDGPVILRGGDTSEAVGVCSFLNDAGHRCILDPASPGVAVARATVSLSPEPTNLLHTLQDIEDNRQALSAWRNRLRDEPADSPARDRTLIPFRNGFVSIPTNHPPSWNPKEPRQPK